jgi:hypothetical protein
VALHYQPLPYHARKQIWQAFLSKLGIGLSSSSSSQDGTVTSGIGEDQLGYLASKEVNGRQIKNAARTAQSLALGRGEKVGFEHFVDTLEAMEGFQREFENACNEDEDEDTQTNSDTTMLKMEAM